MLKVTIDLGGSVRRFRRSLIRIRWALRRLSRQYERANDLTPGTMIEELHTPFKKREAGNDTLR